MPTNVSPEFKKAKEAFQSAREPAERLQCLKEMLRTVPKHKGTEHLQADIKTRIKELTDELAGPKKKGARTGPAHTVRLEGAAQVALVGPPNSGKSSLHARLTGSHAEVGPYPHTTHAPLPGMMPYKDIYIQLVDLPPIGADYMEPWMSNALQPAHAVLLVVDLGLAGCVENVAAIRQRLDQRRVTLHEYWRGKLDASRLVVPGPAPSPRAQSDGDGGGRGDETDDEDPFRVHLPTLLVANKCDINSDPEEIAVLEELIEVHYPAVSVSAETGDGLDAIGALLFQGLEIVRVYTKIPGHPADIDRPYTLFQGGTVEDVAHLVHKDVAASLRFARLWGSGKFDGQQVGKDHPVNDGDIVELHS
jgi:ribosome-interacting GTPase 1